MLLPALIPLIEPQRNPALMRDSSGTFPGSTSFGEWLLSKEGLSPSISFIVKRAENYK